MGASVYALVGLGSAVGSLLRVLAATAVQGPAATFPWGTLFVNVTGSFAIGLYAALISPGGRMRPGIKQAQFVMTGVCGGYTTFSIFSLETLLLLQAGKMGAGAANVGISTVAWLAAMWLGYAFGAGLNRRQRS